MGAALYGGWLVEYPDEEAIQVSHETMYRRLFIQARGIRKTGLMKHLRMRRKMRRSKRASTKGRPHGQVIGTVRSANVQPKPGLFPVTGKGDLLHG